MTNHARRVRRSKPRAAAVARAQMSHAVAGCLCTPTQRVVHEAGELVVEVHHRALCPAVGFDQVVGRIRA